MSGGGFEWETSFAIRGAGGVGVTRMWGAVQRGSVRVKNTRRNGNSTVPSSSAG